MAVAWLKPESQQLVYVLIVKPHVSVVAEKYVTRVMVEAHPENLKLILVRLIALDIVRMDVKEDALENVQLDVKMYVGKNAKQTVLLNVQMVVLLDAMLDVIQDAIKDALPVVETVVIENVPEVVRTK